MSMYHVYQYIRPRCTTFSVSFNIFVQLTTVPAQMIYQVVGSLRIGTMQEKLQ